MSQKVIPVGAKLLIKQKEAEKYFAGTEIIIPDTARKKEYKGIFNVGRKKISDYDLFKKYKKNIKKTTIKKIQEKKQYNLSIDASMNCNKFKKVLKKKPNRMAMTYVKVCCKRV